MHEVKLAAVCRSEAAPRGTHIMTDVAQLVRAHAVDNTIVVTFSNDRQRHITENWVYHLQQLGVGGLLVGMMNMQPEQPSYVALAQKLRAKGVGVYTVNSREVRTQPQGGRWFHVLPLLRTGCRVLLSDSDAVWLRNPLPYLRALEQRHPRLDFAVSSDAQDGTDGLRLSGKGGDGKRGGRGGGRGRRRHRGGGGRGGRGGRGGSGADGTAAEPSTPAVADELADELDIEDYGHCWQSMNIGIMFFPPGARPGSLRLLEEATAHLSAPGNLRRVDQGPLNYRWKHGAGKWRWPRQLHKVRDATGRRLCGLVDGNVTGGVLPSAQFCNTLTHDVLQLWRKKKLGGDVRPYVVHATWMRNQAEPFKLARLREAKLWRDAPTWYAAPASTATAAVTAADDGNRGAAAAAAAAAASSGVLGPSTPAAGFVTFSLDLPEALLHVPRVTRGALPLHHLRLVHEQLKRLRSALFVARALGRALVLPEALCSCELGFWPNHIEEHCKAVQHVQSAALVAPQLASCNWI